MMDLIEQWFLQEIYDAIIDEVESSSPMTKPDIAWCERCELEKLIGEENPHMLRLLESMETHEKICCLKCFQFGIQVGLEMHSVNMVSSICLYQSAAAKHSQGSLFVSP